MKLSDLRNRKWYYLAIAFAMPFLLFVAMMIFAGVTPFGMKSLLYSDNFHQYYPFFKAFRKALINGDSLLYSWDVGIGIDYLGLISYYLGSPLNFLSVLVPESCLLSYYTLLTPIRLGLASLFFSIFLKRLFHRNDYSIALFGSFYGLCAWALGYQWNVMWLDTFALLPLVALGTVYLLRDKKYVLYTVTLTLSIICNYYVGFFVCIFVLLLFICYQICRCKSFKQLFLDFVRIGIFTVLAIGMTVFLELPALAALGNAYSSGSGYYDSYVLNIVPSEELTALKEASQAYQQAKAAGEPTFALWYAMIKESFVPVLTGMAQVAGNSAGGISPTFIEGLPNVYCGVGTLMLAMIFLFIPGVKLRDKICSIVMLAFLAMSFVVRRLDYMWHGFHFTNQIPYRFSFLYSFVLLYMAYRAYLMRRRFKTWHLILGGAFAAEVILMSSLVSKIPDAIDTLGILFERIGQVLSTSFAGDKEANKVALLSLESLYNTHGKVYAFLVFNLVFFCLYLGILFYPKLQKALPQKAKMNERRKMASRRINRRKIATRLLSFVLTLELVMNVVNFGVNFAYTDIQNYPKQTTYSESMIRYMQEREDSLFYRAETTLTQTLNDGALNGYYGISTFTSSANYKVTNFMNGLGYAARDYWNRYAFEQASPVSNLFLNLKYMIERENRVQYNPYFTEIHHYGDVHLLENTAYLPLGFLAESALKNVQLKRFGSNAFAVQNHLFQNATGLTTSVWNHTPDSWLTIDGNKIDFSYRINSGDCEYKATGSGASITYTYQIQDDGLLCLDFSRNDNQAKVGKTFTVKLNDRTLYSYENITLAQSLSVGQVKAGDELVITTSCSSNEQSMFSIRAALLDDDVFQRGYAILNRSTLNLTEFSTTRVTGTIACDRNGLLYTSIPNDGNWKATVDGKDAEIVLVGDAMIGLELTAGEHDIVFTYVNESYNTGSMISWLCLFVFLGILYVDHRIAINSKVSSVYKKLTSKETMKKKNKKK